MINLTIFSKSTPHTLRAISLATFPPAFIILLIHGLISHRVNPAIGLLPLFFSSAYSALLLVNERRCGCQAGGLTGTLFHFILDFSIGAGLLTCLILSWVFLGKHCDDGVVLGAYGTNFLICNFLIHLFFVANQVNEAMTAGSNYPTSCPHCQTGSISFSVGGFQFGTSLKTGLKNGYSPLLDGEGEPRASTDDRADGGESMV